MATATVPPSVDQSQATRHRIKLAFPGPRFVWGAVQGIINCTRGRHLIEATNSGNGWDDFNACWCDALNAYERGEVTHFAMLHSDLTPSPGWLDTLLEEMDRLNAGLVSVPAAIKDDRGLTSSGIGDPTNDWYPLRRITVRELAALPETFDAETLGYPGGILLHNTGCWVCDLRWPQFRHADQHGLLQAYFNFTRRVVRGDDGQWLPQCESEDWYFSRQIHALGVPSAITQKVRLLHHGEWHYPNFGEWGRYENGDEDTAHKWRR